MYCKHSGKQIADDSTFCQYCGGKLVPLQTANPIKEEPISESDKEKQEIVLTTKENTALQVEIIKKKTNHSSVIANEFVGNFKMLGLAVGLFIVYMLGFVAIHQKDIKVYDFPNSSYFGESCYDPNTLSGNWIFDWEEHYYKDLYWKVYKDIPFSLTNRSAKEYLKDAESLEKRLNLTEIEIGVYRESAKESAKKDRQDWADTINNHRKWGYEKDLKNNATYASIICLLLCILGRYIVKLIKWINSNKTE